MDFNRSLFISSQLPGYIRENYPLFVSFLEGYYGYLDRSVGQLIGAKVNYDLVTGLALYGSNYTAPTVSIRIIDNTVGSVTYGTYIADYKGAVLTPVLRNGRIEKITISSYGGGYTDLDKAIINISDTTGVGASYGPVIVDNLGNINQATKTVATVRDIDQEFSLITTYLENEYIPNFPKKLYSDSQVAVEAKAFIKFIKQFYGKKGTTDSIKFLYRILFNVDVNLYYPSTDMLRISDGKWSQNKYLSVTPVSGINLNSYIGNRIITNTSHTSALIQGATSPVGTYWLLNVSVAGSTGFSNTPEAIYNYPASGKAEQIGTTYNTGATSVFYNGVGSYTGTDGQLSANKFIQDSYFYQQFSYQLRSSDSIKNFYNVLEELIHPAGLKYFIFLTLESMAAVNLHLDTETNINPSPDIIIESVSSPASKSLGPTYQSIANRKNMSVPSFYIDFSGTGIITGSTGATGVLTLANINSNFENSTSNLVGLTAIITPTGATGVQYATITAWNSTAKTATISPTVQFGSPYATYGYRIIENYIPSFVNNTSSPGLLVGATAYDSALNYYTFNNYLVSTVAARVGATGVGATGAVSVVSQNDNYYNTNDILLVDSEKMLILGATGTLAGATSVLTVTRGYYSTTAAAHTIGATAFNSSRHLFRDYKLYITSGVGAGQSSIIIGYDGASGILKYSPAFSTAPVAGNSTYFIYPDLYNNSGYFTTSVQNSVLTAGGSQYSNLSTATIDAPLAGTQATATLTNVSGVITALTLGATGLGYITTPKLTISDFGSTGVKLASSLSSGATPGATQLIGITGFSGSLPNTGTIINNTESITIIGSTGATGLTILRGSAPGSTGVNAVLTLNSVGSGALGYVNLMQNSASPSSQFFKYSSVGGVILVVTDTVNKFIQAYAKSYITNNVVTKITITNGGQGYTTIPGIKLNNGGYSTRATATTTINSGVVLSSVVTGIGQGYSSAPVVVIDSPGFKRGDRVTQTNTNAIGTIDQWDTTNNLLYIIKDTFFHEFNSTPNLYYGININVDSIQGFNNTLGKRIKSIQESEINIIKV